MSTDGTRSATEDRLATTLRAVALATPTVDRSDDLRAALDRADASGGADASDRLRAVAPAGEVTGPRDAAVDLDELPVADIGRRRRAGSRRTRLTLAAAAAVLVALAAVAVVVTRGSDRDEGVIATPPPAGDLSTGWFLPPAGWDLVSVYANTIPHDMGPIVCPCTQWAAARPGDAPALIDVAESTLDDAGAAGLLPSDPIDAGDGATGLLPSDPIDAGDGATGLLPSDPIDVDGRPGTVNHQDDVSLLQVTSGARSLLVKALGVDDATLAGVADAWLDQRDAGAPIDTSGLEVPAGFVGTALRETDPGFDSELRVLIREAATGREVGYQLSPPETYREAVLASTTITVDDGVITGEGGSGDDAVVAAIGGPTDVTMGGYDSDAPPGDLSPDARRELFAGLHQVSTAEWRAALAGADGDVDAEVRQAADLFSPPLTGR